MASVTFRWDRSGYVGVCNMAGVQSLVEARAREIASSAKAKLDPDEGYILDDYEVKDFTTKLGATGRVVRTKTDHARYSQNKNKTLTKALKGA